MLPKKTVLTTPEGTDFIHYESEKLRMMVEVHQDDNRETAYAALMENANILAEIMPHLFYKTIKYNGRWYILCVIEAENRLNNPILQFEKMVENQLEKLSSLYLNAYLIK
jgi:hypothetical protein